jgi:GTP-binding protein EngB required for normal cell division
MVDTSLGDRLGPVLHGLTALADGPAADELAELRGRLAEQRFRLLVVGEAKRGKSTLINALLGRPLLPSGVTPVTALPTELRYGQTEQLVVSYLDRTSAHRPLADLPRFVTEQHNPGNVLAVARVSAYLDAPVLAGGVEIVDTPGTGSVFAHNTTEATAVLSTMDAAVLVLSADPPLSGSERDLLRQVHQRSVALFVALNKVERLRADERGEALEFVRKHLADAVAGDPVAVYPLSARDALTARAGGDAAGLVDSGLSALERDLYGYLDTHRVADLYRSVARHADRIAARLTDAAALTLRSAELAARQDGDRVDRFRRQVSALDHHAADAAAIVTAGTELVLATLNRAAPRDTLDATRTLRADLASWSQRGELPALPPARYEDAGREYLVEQIRSVVDGWRVEWESTATAELRELDERLTAALEERLAAVRDTARDELGLSLALPMPAGSLLPEIDVDLAFGAEVGMTVAVGDTIRRHLMPGQLGRTMARRHLLDELDILVGKQFGRTRSALQDAITAAGRELRALAARRAADAVSGLVAALDSATAMVGASDVDARCRVLLDRIERLRALRAELARIVEVPDVASGRR